MKKVFMFTLALFVLLFIVAIATSCGKVAGEKGNANTNSNTGSLYITTWYPSTGETKVSSNASISIIFNNSIDVEKFDPSLMLFADDHTAGEPVGGMAGANYSWASENRILTISEIIWPGVETNNDPPVKVHVLNNGAFEDMDGNILPFGTTIANYEIETNLSRYYPTKLNTTWGFSVSNTKYPTQTYETQTIVPGTFGSYKNVSSYRYEPGPTLSGTASVYSTDSIVYLNIFYYALPEWIGTIMFDNSNNNGMPRIGSYFYIYEPTLELTFETEVLAKEDVVVPYGTFPSYKCSMKMPSPEDPDNYTLTTAWYVYNIGPIKSDGIVHISGVTTHVSTYELKHFSKP
jgi:hypothetical protein